MSEKENCANNQRLHEEIKQFNYRVLIAGDPDFIWFEESFAVEADLGIALELGRKYGQNAIFYVTEGQLFLHSCVDAQEQHLGPFTEKVL